MGNYSRRKVDFLIDRRGRVFQSGRLVSVLLPPFPSIDIMHPVLHPTTTSFVTYGRYLRPLQPLKRLLSMRWQLLYDSRLFSTLTPFSNWML